MKTIRLLGLLFLLTGSVLANHASAQPSISASEAAWVEEGKQLFLARTQLQAYREELNKYGVGQAMGLDETLGEKALTNDNGFLTLFEQSFRLTAFNTFNYARLLFTNREEQLLQEWSLQCEELDHTIFALQIVYGVMEDREVRLAEAFQIVETESRYAEARPWTEALAQSPWSQQVLSGAQLSKRPVVPADFGLDFKTDFVDENWKTFLSEQVNIANVYIFARGGEIISALGKTKLGMAIAQTLRLNKLIVAIKTLPAAVQKPALWMIYETADGCTIRYFYTAYLGLKQLGQEKTARVTGTVGR